MNLKIKKALSSPEGRKVIEAALKSGECVVVNRHSICVSELEWVPKEDLQWLDPAPVRGCWAYDSGFVVLATSLKGGQGV